MNERAAKPNNGMPGLCFVCLRKSEGLHLRDQPRFSDPAMKWPEEID